MYIVTQREGCTFVEGTVPVDDLLVIAALAGPDAVMSPHLARLAGVMMAWGAPADVAALEAVLTQEAKQRAAGLDDVGRWLQTGEHGLSSLAMVQHLTGRRVTNSPKAYPHDPDDLHRCRLLLEQAPSLVPQLPRMATLSPAWARLVAEWDALCAQMDSEAPLWREGKGSAPATANRMRQLIAGART